MKETKPEAPEEMEKQLWIKTYIAVVGKAANSQSPLAALLDSAKWAADTAVDEFHGKFGKDD